MAELHLAVDDPLAVKLWERRVAREAIKQTYIGRFIGKNPGSLIQLKGMTNKGPGDKVTCGLRMTPTGDGVTENEDLEGNEESLNLHDDSLFINELSHGLRSEDRITPQRVPFSIREEIRAGLSDWYAVRMDTAFFNQVCGYTAQTNTKYTGLNAAIAPSSTRALWTAASGAVSSSSDDQTVGAQSAWTFNHVGYIEDMVTLARTADPMIQPLKIDGREKYVLFLHDHQVRDLRKAKSSSLVTWWDAQSSLISGGYLDRKKLATVYQGSIGEWNDVIIHRANRVTLGVNSSTGAAVSNTRRAVLCGAQAAIMAFGKGYSFERFGWVEETFDYKRKYGASCQTVFGLKKSVYNSLDYGTVTLTSYAA